MNSISSALSAEHQSVGLLHRFGAIFRDFGAILRATHEVERLLGCSDAGLERRGLQRSEIVPHVFGTYLGRWQR